MMTEEARKRYEEKDARIRATIALKEPDRVPIAPSPAIYPYLHAGYTMTDVIYDETMEKASQAMIRYLTEFVGIADTVAGTKEPAVFKRFS